MEWNGTSFEKRWDSENVSLEFINVSTDNIVASRLKKEDEHGIWTTDFILNQDGKYMSVSVSLETTEFTTDFSPTYYPPYFVKLIVYGQYTGDDNGIIVSQKPHLASEFKEIISQINNHKLKMRLPIVCFPKYEPETGGINLEDLAFRLQGVAHVVYEDGDNINDFYANDLEKNNKIIIFFPSINKQPCILNYPETDADKDYAINRLINEVYNYMTLRVRKSIDTWDGVINEQLRLRNQELRKTKENVEEENDLLYEEFGDQLTKMEEANQRLSNEVQKLTAEVQGLRLKMSDKGQIPVIVSGTEREFYSGEVREIVLEILEEYLKKCYEGSRREHVVKDLLDNNEFLHIPEKRRETLKNALKGYRSLSASLKSELESLGIEISSDGKHYKWSYYGDNRYVTTVAKTSSDGGRAGMNMAATMDKLML